MAPFAKAPNSCELNRQMQRNWTVQIKPVGADPAQYIFVRGLTSAVPNIETQTTDASDIDSNGWTATDKVSRSLTINLEGKYIQKGEIPVLDEATTLLKLTGEELGQDGKVDFRIWRHDTDEGWEGTATNTFTSSAGDANSHRQYTAALASSCEPTRIHSVEEGADKEASVPVDVEELLAVIRPAPAPGG